MDKQKSLRSSAVLTGSYVAATVWGPSGGNTAVDPSEHNTLLLNLAFTIGSLDSLELKIEFSDDGTTYYQEVEETISNGTGSDTPLVHQFDASGNSQLAVAIATRYIKVSVKGTGTVTSSLLAIDAVLTNR